MGKGAYHTSPPGGDSYDEKWVPSKVGVPTHAAVFMGLRVWPYKITLTGPPNPGASGGVDRISVHARRRVAVWQGRRATPRLGGGAGVLRERGHAPSTQQRPAWSCA